VRKLRSQYVRGLTAMKRLAMVLGEICLVVLVAFVSISVIRSQTEGTKYHVDSINGDDSYDGKSPSSAWQSLDKVNSMVFKPGDSILLKAGCSWVGQLKPKGSGSSSNQITIDMYGYDAQPRHMRNKPHIDGNGAYATVLLEGVEYWTVSNLDVSNTTRATHWQRRNGIVVLAKPVGITHRIIIQDCEVHHVDGDYRRNIGNFNMYKNSGIRVSYPGTSSAENRYDEVLIQRNFVHDVKTSGIYVVSEEDDHLEIFYTNVKVANNTVVRTGADGAIISHCISPVIEHNQIFDAGYHGNYLSTRVIAGLWGDNNTGEILFQYNEVARTRKFQGDGQAFDTDWGTGGTSIFQYNYTHENEGGFFLNCADLRPNPDYVKTILRYNVSVDDKQSMIWRDSATAVEVYNNVFYKTVGNLDPGNSETYKYWNNIFHFSLEPNWGSCEYSHNCYFPIQKNKNDPNGITGDPRFVKPGWLGDGRKNADAYKIKADSSCIDKGKSIPNNGGKDFWDNPLDKGLPDIGAMEYSE
jgi:hypothetical protein